jgi:hypothetical protein
MRPRRPVSFSHSPSLSSPPPPTNSSLNPALRRQDGGSLYPNEAWKPLPECLADDLWPCALAPPGWPGVWPITHVRSKGAQPHRPAGGGAGGGSKVSFKLGRAGKEWEV